MQSFVINLTIARRLRSVLGRQKKWYSKENISGTLEAVEEQPQRPRRVLNDGAEKIGPTGKTIQSSRRFYVVRITHYWKFDLYTHIYMHPGLKGFSS